MHDTSQILELATTACRRVGERIRSEVLNPTNYRIMEKAGAEIVTEVDVWADAEIKKIILQKYPEHLVVGEESVDSVQGDLQQLVQSGVTWIVDPIDGTTNFSKAIPQVSISIGIFAEGKRIAGVVYDPVRDELFTAALGKGAQLNGEAIRVSSQANLQQSVIATGFPYDHVAKWGLYKPVYEAIFLQVRDIRRFGSAALDQCWVACGRFDAFFEYSLRPWDVAAGSLIVEEAGGKIGNLQENAFSVFGQCFLFSNPELYSDLHLVGTQAMYGSK